MFYATGKQSLTRQSFFLSRSLQQSVLALLFKNKRLILYDKKHAIKSKKSLPKFFDNESVSRQKMFRN